MSIITIGATGGPSKASSFPSSAWLPEGKGISMSNLVYRTYTDETSLEWELIVMVFMIKGISPSCSLASQRRGYASRHVAKCGAAQSLGESQEILR